MEKKRNKMWLYISILLIIVNIGLLSYVLCPHFNSSFTENTYLIFGFIGMACITANIITFQFYYNGE